MNDKCSYCLVFSLVKDKDKLFDISKIYDLSNHEKVPNEKINVTTTSHVDSFHGRFSVLSALSTPFKLKI